MKNVKNFAEKCGKSVAACAFAFAKVSANSACAFPYYEPEEPKNLGKFKKFSK